MSNFIREMFYNNHWLWVHILAAAVGAKVLAVFLAAQSIILVVFVAAVLYEVWQWATGEHRNFPDAVADVLMAVVSAGIVVW